jgi:hypothetical protein
MAKPPDPLEKRGLHQKVLGLTVVDNNGRFSQYPVHCGIEAGKTAVSLGRQLLHPLIVYGSQ